MDFNDHCATPFAAEAHKRVDYNYGLVLGVGEFRSEQSYFLEKHRRHARGLHGYGTVAGLAVTARDTENGPEIRVSPGLAIDPHGREICVPETQCALLNDWLLQRQQAGELSALLEGSIPDHVTVYLTLCHRECKTDEVPIPVGPCHSLEKSSVPSRIQDAFELRLADSPPAQPEQEAIRAFAALMDRVSVGTGPDALTTPDALVAEIRSLPPDQPPPETSGVVPTDFLLDPDHAAEIVRTALRVYVTEVRPMLVPEGGGCLDGPRDATCVLLAQLDFEADLDGEVPQVRGDVEITQEDRPLLLSTRTLQADWFDNRLRAAAEGGAGPTVVAYRPLDNERAFYMRTLTLEPVAAQPVNAEAVRASLGDGLSAIRFFNSGAAAFNFAPPTDLLARTGFLRLNWAYTGETEEATALLWEATLRFLSDGDDVTASTAAAPIRIEASTSEHDPGHLIVGEWQDLEVDAGTQPLMGILAVRLTTGDGTPIPDELAVYLVAAELIYSGRGGGS